MSAQQECGLPHSPLHFPQRPLISSSSPDINARSSSSLPDSIINSRPPSSSSSSPSPSDSIISRRPSLSDRFIPSVVWDSDLSHFNLTRTPAEHSTRVTAAQLAYNQSLENALFEGNASKILSFKETSVPKNHHLNSLHALYTAKPPAAPRKVRTIPTAAERILDAPGLRNDFYLNLLDWGANNELAVALADCVYLWNYSTAAITELLTLDSSAIVTSVSWNKQASHLAVGTSLNTVQLWDIHSMKCVRTLDGHSARVGSLAWRDSILSSGSGDSTIVNHDVRACQHKIATLRGHTHEVCGLRWNYGGQLASGGNDSTVNIWDLSRNKPFYTLQHNAAVKALAWCPLQPNLLATGAGLNDGNIRIWNTNTGNCVNDVNTHSQVGQLMWSVNYNELISGHGSPHNNLIVWKYPALTQVASLFGHDGRVLQLAMSPDGETVASAAKEDIRLWKVFAKDSVSPHKTVVEQFSSSKTIR